MNNDIEENRKDIDTFRVGNFVEFPGYSFLEITNIDESTGSKTYSVTLNGQERTGIPDGMMRGIPIEEKHLTALGLTKDDHNILPESINIVHKLQNHFADDGWKIDFSPLRQFQNMIKR